MSQIEASRIWASTLGDLLLQRADAAADADLLIFPDSRLTYGAMAERAYARARSLYALGIRNGDHVGVLMPNCPEYIELLFGIALLGGIAVPMNARYKSSELAYVAENADLVALVCHDLASEYVDFAHLLAGAFAEISAAGAPQGQGLHLAGASKLRSLIMLGGSKPPGFMDEQQFCSLGNKVNNSQVDTLRCKVRLRDPCIMMYTSGTTANPKGCPLSHEALVRNGVNMNRERYFLTATDRFWAPLPMFHMACVLPLIACIDAGAAMLSMNRIDAGEALAMMEREQVSVAFP